MHIRPILAALRHHKAGTLLIALQIALTLAIVCNALFIIHERVVHLSQPTGLDEDHVLVIRNQWANKPSAGNISSLMADDLTTLRKVPGVASAYATDAYPLSGGGIAFSIGHSPDKRKFVSTTAIYFGDENALPTLGLKLVAGRNFRADEIGEIGGRDKIAPPVLIVTRALAERLFPGEPAVGKLAYISDKPSIIVGVVERLQSPYVDSALAQWADCSTLMPFRQLVSPTTYMVRTQAG